jgi:hypothetical protein
LQYKPDSICGKYSRRRPAFMLLSGFCLDLESRFQIPGSLCEVPPDNISTISELTNCNNPAKVKNYFWLLERELGGEPLKFTTDLLQAYDSLVFLIHSKSSDN